MGMPINIFSADAWAQTYSSNNGLPGETTQRKRAAVGQEDAGASGRTLSPEQAITRGQEVLDSKDSADARFKAVISGESFVKTNEANHAGIYNPKMFK